MTIQPPPTDAIPHFSANLQASPGGASFAAFRQNSAAMCEIGLREGASAAEFWFSTTLFQLPRAMLFKAEGAGHTTRRGPDHIAQGNSQIAIFAFLKGRSEAICPGRVVSAGPGEVVIYDYDRPHDSSQTEYEAIVLMVPRERVPAEFLTPASHGAVLPAGSGAASLIHGMLVALFEAAGNLTIAEAEAAIDAVILTARASLVALANANGARSPSDGDTMQQAMAYIARNLSDPGLGAPRLQDQFGLSRSSLYRLFEPQGGVNAVILRHRLDACLRALLTGDATDEPRWKLVTDHGFANEAQFSRAFARRFAVTPRAFSDMVSRRDHAGLTAQAQRAGFVTLQDWLDHVAGRADGPGAADGPSRS